MNSLKLYFTDKSYYVGRIFSGIKGVYDNINPALLTGAIDVIVIKQPDGSYVSGPFHVCFGKMGAIRPTDKIVDVILNDVLIEGLCMKLGSAGEAFFVEEVTDDKASEHSDDTNNLLNISITRARSLDTLPICKEEISKESKFELDKEQSDICSGTEADEEGDEGNEHMRERRRRKVRRHGDTSVTSPAIDTLTLPINEESIFNLDTDKMCTIKYASDDEQEQISAQRLSGYKSDSALDQSIEESNVTWEWGSFPETATTPVKRNYTEKEISSNSNNKISDASLDTNSAKTEGVYLDDIENIDQNMKDTYIYAPSPNSNHTGDTGYRSDGEISPPPYPSISDIKLSLCGGLTANEMISLDLFNQHLVSYEEFVQQPDAILANPNLVVLLNGKFYPWPIAGPMIVAVIGFQAQLSQFCLQKLQNQYMPKKTYSNKKSWFSWGRRSDEVSTSVNIARKNSDSGLSTTRVDTDPSISSSNNAAASKPIPELKKPKIYRKKNRLSSEEIVLLNLQEGENDIEYRMVTRYQGTVSCKASIHLWNWYDRIVISDVDGTITRSDVLGQVLPILGKDWTQAGIARLYRNISQNGYRFIYLSARAIGMSENTRNFLTQVTQDENLSLPNGPVLLSPSSLLRALHREVIERKPEIFKIECLKDVRALFPENTSPLFAGFGNKINDVIAYKAAGIHESRIFTVNPSNQLRNEVSQVFRSSYSKMSVLVDNFFPYQSESFAPVDPVVFSQYTFWRDPLPDITDPKLLSVNPGDKDKLKSGATSSIVS